MLTQSNPPVGCVIVYKGEIISRGHTQEPGKHHAEAMAIHNLQILDYENMSLFATLEPCSFQGKTPSCAKTIVEKGFKEIYVGIIDPLPKNQGMGIKILEDAGIKVEVGILEKEIFKDLNEYLIK